MRGYGVSLCTTQDVWEHRRTFIRSPIQERVALLHILASASLDICRSCGTGGGCRQRNGFRELYFRQGVNLELFLDEACGDSGCGSSIPPFSGSPLNEELPRVTESSRPTVEGLPSAGRIGDVGAVAAVGAKVTGGWLGRKWASGLLERWVSRASIRQNKVASRKQETDEKSECESKHWSAGLLTID